MTHHEINIGQLMIEKLTGIINEKDACYLDKALESQEIRQQWEEIKKKFNASERDSSLKFDAGQAWVTFRNGIEDSKRLKTIRIRKLAIAASFIVTLLIAGMYFFQPGALGPVVQLAGSATSSKPERSVKLYVDGSKAYNLSENNSLSDVRGIKNARLKVGNNSLSFIPLNKESRTLNTIVIPETLTYKITLSDGTEVWLNSMSQLKFPFVFSEHTREVWINGEAYFKVAKNAYQPFIVHTSLTETKVLGTEFNINTYDTLNIKTALVEGSINTRAVNGKNILLKPGYEATLGQEGKFNVESFDTNNKLSWMHGTYYFQNASMKDIADVIHRWYGDKLIFDNSKASSIRFSGALFKDKPLKEFLGNMALTSNIRYFYSSQGEVHLYIHS